MSSRALRRLQQEAAVIKVSGGAELSSEDGEERPGFSGRVKKKQQHQQQAAANPFAMVSSLARSWIW